MLIRIATAPFSATPGFHPKAKIAERTAALSSTDATNLAEE
jgi:hypothetical protein